MSKRRHTPCSDRNKIVRDGVVLCVMCEKPVPKGRRKYCSEDCSTEAVIRANPSVAAHYVFQRDKGVCSICGLDCNALVGYFRKLRSDVSYTQSMYTNQTITLETVAAIKEAYAELSDWLRDCGFSPWSFDRYWHADHIVPVADGGGSCGIENLRTLCIPCHKSVTADWRRQRASERKAQACLPVS